MLDMSSAIESIEEAIDKHDYAIAFRFASELASAHPENKKAKHLLLKVNKYLDEELKNKVHETIKENKHLWREKKYQELFVLYNRLYEIFPSYPGLEETLKDLREKVDDQRISVAQNFIAISQKKIRKLISAGNYKDAIKACQEFFKFDPTSKIVFKLYLKAKNKFVGEKILHGETLIKLKKFKQALSFFEHLFRIAPENARIKKDLLKIQNILSVEESSHKKEAISGKYLLIHKLLQEKDYDDAIRNCHQLILIDPAQQKAKKLILKITRKLRSIIDNEIIDQMLVEQSVLRQEYEMKRGDVVRL